MAKQNDSDPLPYVQVDRAVKPKAALLANHLKSSNQHALGSLVEWWDLCGDPRELERIIEATPPGEEPKVVLTGEDAQLRFHLASGHEVQPIVLTRLGLVESIGKDRYRVRGMSRYFEPIANRLDARRKAVAGGKASAEARRQTNGTAQPPGGRGSKVVRTTSEADAEPATEPGTEPPPNQEPNRDGTPRNPSGQRSAVSSLKEDLSPLASEPPPAPKKRKAKAKPQAALPLEPTAQGSEEAAEVEPERRLSRQEEAWDSLQAWRAVACRERGLPDADEPAEVVEINAKLGRACKRLGELTGARVGPEDLDPYFEVFVSIERFATYDPPWPINAFCHPETLKGLARVVEARASGRYDA